jgi:peptide/nickel transport system substrate-binding protein
MRTNKSDCAARIVAGFFAIAVLASACTSGGAEEAPSSDGADLFGGTLRLAIVRGRLLSEPAFLDPARPYNPFNGIDPELMRCCLARTLLSYSGLAVEEGGTELRPDLASAMPTVSRDGLTWTFRLKGGIHYAPPLEEVEITAADVARGIRRTAAVEVSEGEYAPYFSVIQGYDAFARGETDTIAGLEIVDAYTLRVHLIEVVNDFGYRMALPGSAPIPPAPGDATSPLGVAEGHDDGYGPYLIASGPYIVQGAGQLDPWKSPAEQLRVPGLTQEGLTLVRNPSWDGSTDNLRDAYVDRIELKVMKRDDAERAFDEGTVDAFFDDVNSLEQVDRYLADPELAPRVEHATFDYWLGFTAMNLAVPPFDDIHVRRAVSFAYDATRWARVANQHLGSFQMGTIVDHVAPDLTEAGLLRGFLPYPFDLAAARGEMARSGYDDDRDGLCDDPACRDVFSIETDYGFERFADKVWIDGLREIGIRLDIHRLGDRRYAEQSRDASRHVALNLGTYYLADYPNASALFETSFTAEGIGGGVSGASFGNVSLVGASPDQLSGWGYEITDVPNVDAKIGTCQSMIGFAQTRCWAELDQKLMIDVVPWVPQTGLVAVGISPDPDRVVRSPWDQATGTWLALDHVALAPGSS